MTSVLQQVLRRSRDLRVNSLFSIADQVASAAVGFLVAVYVGRQMGGNGATVLFPELLKHFSKKA